MSNFNKEDKLRAWYLARLRQRAFISTQKLTPGKLMHADRQFIKDLILAEAKPDRGDRSSGPSSWPVIYAFIVSYLVTLGLFFLSLLILLKGDISASLLMLYRLTIGTLLADGPLVAEISNQTYLVLVGPLVAFGTPMLIWTVLAIQISGRYGR